MTFIIGHRGARNEAPENTLPSFKLAQANGCLAFELDVRLSKDRELMVFHDATLKRTTGRLALLSQTHSETLKSLDARRSFSWPDPCPIPTLAQVFEAVPETIDWQLEVKATTRSRMRLIAQRLATFIEERALDNDSKSVKNEGKARITITSSSEWFLSEFKRQNRELRTGYVAEHKRKDQIALCQKLECELLAIHDPLCTRALIERAHRVGLEVSTWTVNTLERMRQLQQVGVDSIITDIPSAALTADYKFAQPLA